MARTWEIADASSLHKFVFFKVFFYVFYNVIFFNQERACINVDWGARVYK